MAGAKGRSGGARPGAGRPKKKPDVLDVPVEQTTDPRKFLTDLMNNLAVDIKLRADAAKALLSAEIRTAEAKGKKEQKQEAAQRVAGRFAAAAPPKLVAAGGKQL